MKKLLILSVLFLSGIITLKADEVKEIKAPISRITVYPDRAQITQEAPVEITSGKTIIRLTGLSPMIDAQSIQVRGMGEYTVLSVNQKNNYIENLDDLPEIKSLRSQIEALQQKIEDEKTAIAVLEEKHNFLNANISAPQKATTFSIDQFKSMMDLYTTSVEQVALSKLKKQRLVKDYEKQLAALQQQIADRKGKQQMPSGEIAVTVSAEKPVTGKMTFTYVVLGASWYPSYDIRVEDITKPVSILYKANVQQITGVEWKNVRLSFSTATPWVAGDVPVLSPWYIDFFTPAPVAVSGYGVARKSAAPAMLEEAVAADESKSIRIRGTSATAAPVEKRVGEMSVTFEAVMPYTIQPDGKVQTIELQNTSIPAEYRYVTVPKSSPMAYLTGNITDWAKQNLSSGEATLYFENTFVGKSTLNVNQLSDTLTISLGTDPNILVKREKRKDFTTRKVIGSNKTETYSFLITLRNNKNTPVKITAIDQIPVSSNSSITVEAAELSGGRLTSDTGMVKWDLDLKPQEKKELILTYSVRYPKNMTVILE